MTPSGYVGLPRCHSLFYSHFNLELELVSLLGDSAALTLPFVTVSVLCLFTDRERHGGRVFGNSRTRLCGARIDTGMRCNLQRVLLDYEMGTAAMLLSMSVGIT